VNVSDRTHDREPACPACGNAVAAAPPLYAVTGVPVQSNLLAPTRADALGFPRGDLRLAFCRACGFVWNAAFDPATQQLSAAYEATQGFSPTFNAFARSLAARWSDRYHLKGKHLLEIGCGRGEFIATLADVSGCASAVGIDPIADPARPPPGAPANLRLVNDCYSERYAHLPADFVCCRHTLEHIPDVGAFVRMVRRVIGTRTDAIVCFEVPDTMRVLREGAFWDLYYEHCSYFTAGSLARLFRAAGFELLDLACEYDGQYLVLEAKPGKTSSRLGAEDDLAAVAEAVRAFPGVCAERIGRWRRLIDDTLGRGRRLAIWGAGSKAVGFCSTLGLSDEQVPLVIDINPHKQNTYLPGTAQRIAGPEALRAYEPDVLIVMNPVYREEIGRDLMRMGLNAEVVAL
jgi:SAM-dependent methyltransferase